MPEPERIHLREVILGWYEGRDRGYSTRGVLKSSATQGEGTREGVRAWVVVAPKSRMRIKPIATTGLLPRPSTTPQPSSTCRCTTHDTPSRVARCLASRRTG